MSDPINPHPPHARQATYDLLARLYLAEPDAHLAYHLRTLPGFTELLPDDAHLPEWLEEEAIEHQWLFGMNLYPYESIFIDHDLMLNTAAADQMAALYQESNFNPQTALLTIQNPKSKIQNPPDHLGLELALMRHLIAAQRQAEATGDHALALHARHLQSRCLHEHLAVWAPTFALTLQRTARRPLHRLLADLTLEMVMEELGIILRPLSDDGRQPMDHGPRGYRSSIPAPIVRTPTPDPRPPTPEEAPDDQTLNSIIKQLITPAEAGIFLSRADISTLASTLELPISIGDRFHMLRGLFEAAGQFDALPSLLDALAHLFTHSQQSLTQLAQTYPAYVPPAQPWQTRIAATLHLIADLRAQAVEL